MARAIAAESPCSAPRGSPVPRLTPGRRRGGDGPGRATRGSTLRDVMLRETGGGIARFFAKPAETPERQQDELAEDLLGEASYDSLPGPSQMWGAATPTPPPVCSPTQPATPPGPCAAGAGVAPIEPCSPTQRAVIRQVCSPTQPAMVIRQACSPTQPAIRQACSPTQPAMGMRQASSPTQPAIRRQVCSPTRRIGGIRQIRSPMQAVTPPAQPANLVPFSSEVASTVGEMLPEEEDEELGPTQMWGAAVGATPSPSPPRRAGAAAYLLPLAVPRRSLSPTMTWREPSRSRSR